MLTQPERATLKDLARDSVQSGLDHLRALDIKLTDYPKSLTVEKASFVTLKINNNLRGCIGSLEAHRPLVVDISHNAFAAAFNDPRFPPLTKNEFPLLEYDISILSVPTAMSVESEKDLYSQLQAHIDGVVLQEGQQRSTFLPCVWESLTTPKEFIQQLKIKAGLDKNYWSDTISFKRYTVEEF